MLKLLICWLIRDVFNKIFIYVDKFSNEGKILIAVLGRYMCFTFI